MGYFDSKEYLEGKLERIRRLEYFLEEYRNKPPEKILGYIESLVICGNVLSGENLKLSSKALAIIFRDNWEELQKMKQKINEEIKSKGS